MVDDVLMMSLLSQYTEYKTREIRFVSLHVLNE